MMFSRVCQHALWAMIALAKAWQSRRWLKAAEIADTFGLPEPMVAKVLQKLVQAGLVQSQRGPKGGFRLRRPPDAVTLLDVVAAVEGAPWLNRCVLGWVQCNEAHPCPLHDLWVPHRAHQREFLQKVRVSDIAITAHF